MSFLKKYSGNIALCISLVIIFIWNILIGCPIDWLFWIPCAGCGMSRALVAVLHFDFYSAWCYHPLIYLMPFVALLYLFRKKIDKKVLKVAGVTIIVLFAVVYVVRVISGDPIVQMDLKDGAIIKIFNI